MAPGNRDNREETCTRIYIYIYTYIYIYSGHPDSGTVIKSHFLFLAHEMLEHLQLASHRATYLKGHFITQDGCLIVHDEDVASHFQACTSMQGADENKSRD